MIRALTRWVDFDSFTTTSSETASSSFALLKRASRGQAMATLLIGLVSEMPLPHHAVGQKPSKSLEQASSKDGAWRHVTANTLPWQAMDRAPWCEQVPSYLRQRTCFDTRFLDTYLHHSPRQCHNTYLPASSLTQGRRSLLTACTKLFHIQLHFLHSPTFLLQLCNNLTMVRPLAVISFLCTPPSWLYFSVVSCSF